jgi:hypothetical protein
LGHRLGHGGTIPLAAAKYQEAVAASTRLRVESRAVAG